MSRHPDGTPRQEPFLRRFNRLKSEARNGARESRDAPPAEPEGEEASPKTDADMPPVESLGPESDFAQFLSSEVSDGLRRLALRKLFHGEAFNVVDGLDEYAEDYTTFTSLGSIVTAEMRHEMEEEARRRARELVASGQEPGHGEDAGAAAQGDETVAEGPVAASQADRDDPAQGDDEAITLTKVPAGKAGEEQA